MKASRTLLAAGLIGMGCALALPAAVGHDKHKEKRDIITVAFGAGLNTAQPGNPANHHVLPNVIKVKEGDVVNFVVGGLHVIRVFERSVSLQDVKNAIPDECQTNPPPFPASCSSVLMPGPVPVLAAEPAGGPSPSGTSLGLPLYYNGLNFLAPPTTPPFTSFSLAENRVEPVSFSKKGWYLVICAVLPHFNDGMYAWVQVRNRDDRDDHRDH